MSSKSFAYAVVGGGIVGLATAWRLLLEGADSVVVLEKEPRLAMHQTGHNSGVIHSGLYYRPGSLKALNCTRGREELYRFCAEHEVPHERCGKLVVAGCEEELPRLDELQRRAAANGLEGIQRLAKEDLGAYEPQVRGVGALHVPQTGIVDFVQVAQTLARLIRRRGGEVRTGWEVRKIAAQGKEYELSGPAGRLRCGYLINCAGLFSDRLARQCGVAPDLSILPFRGEYFCLKPKAAGLVRHLIYPVPDPALPFLGVHLTRMMDGRVEAGPNAVLAWKREGYGRTSFNFRDALEILAFKGFWRLVPQFWRLGLREYRRSFSRRLFLADLQRLVPALQLEHLGARGSGVRAQAVAPTGQLIDDFRILAAPGMMHVLNAPSPAATASLAIGASIVARLRAEGS
ncbi:L-2-hydroxyglutarate oxidase [Geoalkalibacter ferrihydriticus]|uniref:Hydroxyglutarate oxidase n=2 Tax=Geoalkalibacter ferrihydriticus TaxID=392333 RepID=A0A0C2DQA8_9BACT|nr:L-2-hydroxyglutarate oxidase [Geoalkalibacter ferrihydriticus]KIH75574.1 hydroxyglutarate oxidase [Geoalkalibacter ferrihydriticus DSM 17813]SDL31243.1 L-2-hydroxyglutarate oxidase [Geoalkalibacter ferrihydriticus]